MKQAVILAGGKGTRLSERLEGIPKPLIDICGKPLIERQIELLKSYNFTHVLLLVNHGAQYIKDFCASRNNWGMQIDCINDGQPRGTAGAVLAILSRLDRDFLVVYGDTMLEVDLARFELFHNSRPDIAATLFLHPNNHPEDSDLVEMDNKGHITAFFPYPHDVSCYYQNLVNAALYCVRRTSLESWSDTIGMLDFGKDIFPAMLRRGDKLLGYNSPEYIKDCGTPSRLDKICADFNSGRVKDSSLNAERPAIFLDRDGTINYDIGHISHHRQLELLPGAEHAIKRLNNSIYRAVVVTNQPVLARGDCSSEELKQIHNKMETLLGRQGAYVDRIYYCPHHPDRGFMGEVAELKTICDCRKPNVGMIELAKKELNIDLSRSWLVGDSSVDLLTAHHAGLRSILVETGFAGLDRRHWITPDFVVPNLSTAVNFILDDYPRLLDMCAQLGGGVNKGDFVFIGGLSRCGKSNFASCLRDFLKSKGLQVVVLTIDRWLRNGDQRQGGVLGRYALEEIGAILSLLVKRTQPVELELPTYDKITHQRIVGKETLLIGVSDVVIVEGTITLALLDTVSKDILHSLFIEVDEEKRHQRVLQEYQLRGLGYDEAEMIYQERQKDEAPTVLETLKLATHCINLELNKAP